MTQSDHSAAASAQPPAGGTARPRLGGRVLVYIAAIVVLALATMAWGWLVWPLVPDDILTLAVLLTVGWFSAWVQESDTGDQVGLSFTSVVLVASVPLVGPAGAAIMGGLIPLFDARRRGTLVQLFNSALIAVMGATGGLAYLYARGAHPVSSEITADQLLVSVGLPLIVANVVISLLNAGLLAGMVQISGGDSRQVLTGMIRETVPLYLGYTVLAFLFVVLWAPAGVGPLSAVLIMAPLFVSRWIYLQFGDEYRAHTRILETLVSAGDSSERAGLAHGRQVEAICVLIAAELGLTARHTRDLRYAAILHDLGRVGLPRSIVAASEPIGPMSIPAIQRHPELGAAIIADIDFLQEAAIAVRHHHERFDGRGYPDGLAGRQIPLLARIIAVADAVDALSTTSLDAMSSDEELLETLRSYAGTVLDPSIVEAVGEAMGSSAWRTVIGASPRDVHTTTWSMHDDPRMAWQNLDRAPIAQVDWDDAAHPGHIANARPLLDARPDARPDPHPDARRDAHPDARELPDGRGREHAP